MFDRGMRATFIAHFTPMMLRPTASALTLFLLLLTACGPSTKVVQSWHKPGFTVEEGTYHKLLVIGLIKDEATRRAAEEQMIKNLKGDGIPSYGYIGADVEKINEAGMNDRMVKDGIDGVLIMRLVDVKKEQTYVPGTTYPAYYGSPWGYYGYAYPMYSTPGYVRTDATYYVETNLYSTGSDGLIWTSTTSTFNPTKLETTVDGIMQAVYWQMKKDGFVVRPKPE